MPDWKEALEELERGARWFTSRKVATEMQVRAATIRAAFEEMEDFQNRARPLLGWLESHGPGAIPCAATKLLEELEARDE